MKAIYELEKIAYAHWSYVKAVLDNHGVEKLTINFAQWEYREGFIDGYYGCERADIHLRAFHYKTAYEHGAKLAAEDRVADGNDAAEVKSALKIDFKLTATEPDNVPMDPSPMDPSQNFGGSTDYYKLPPGATDLQDLIEYKDMDFSRGNIFKAVYRLGENGEDPERDLNKIIWFATRMLKKK